MLGKGFVALASSPMVGALLMFLLALIAERFG